jgi:hypothetical protein
MKENSLKERIFIFDMFQDVEQKNHVKLSLEFRIPLANVIAANIASGGQALFQGGLIQVETLDFTAMGFFDLLLEQAVPAPDFRQFARDSDHPSCKTLENIKSTAYPEMVGSGDLKPPVRHADFGRTRQIQYVSHLDFPSQIIYRLVARPS